MIYFPRASAFPVSPQYQTPQGRRTLEGEHDGQVVWYLRVVRPTTERVAHPERFGHGWRGVVEPWQGSLKATIQTPHPSALVRPTLCTSEKVRGSVENMPVVNCLQRKHAETSTTHFEFSQNGTSAR